MVTRASVRSPLRPSVSRSVRLFQRSPNATALTLDDYAARAIASLVLVRETADKPSRSRTMFAALLLRAHSCPRGLQRSGQTRGIIRIKMDGTEKPGSARLSRNLTGHERNTSKNMNNLFENRLRRSRFRILLAYKVIEVNEKTKRLRNTQTTRSDTLVTFTGRGMRRRGVIRRARARARCHLSRNEYLTEPRSSRVVIAWASPKNPTVVQAPDIFITSRL